MDASANRLSAIWERSVSEPLDIPTVPNGLWMDNNSPWSSPSGSPKFNFCSTVCNETPSVQGMNTSKVFASTSCSYPSPMSPPLAVRPMKCHVQPPPSKVKPAYAKPFQKGSLDNWCTLEDELEAWEKRLSRARSGRATIPHSQLLAFGDLVRRLRTTVRRKCEEGLDLCAFCRNNGEPFNVYITHKVRDPSGRVTCPVLRLLSCPLCKSTGDAAHTIKYCPFNRKERF